VVVAAKTGDLVDGVRIPRSSVVRLDPADADALAAAVGPATSVVLVGRGAVRWRTATGTDRAATVTGVRVLGPAPPTSVAAGRALAPADADAAVAVVSSSLARAIAPADAAAAVGQMLPIGDEPLRIVGVLARPEGRDPPALQVPFGRLARLPLPAAEPPSITLRAGSVEDVAALKRTVDAWAAARHGDAVAISAFGPERLRQAAQGILIFKLLMGSFTAIALFVGGIGIMNVLLASVLERTREIGIRRAVGARRRDVVRQLLAESIAISLAGSLLGLAVGLGSAFAFTAVMRAQTEALIYAAVTPATIAASLGAAIVTGLVFGVYPALRASWLVPVDAIRAE
jgi:putative ABC transport system permease protein